MVRHRLGYTTWYAHLSMITTWVGERVTGGTRLGYVGSTGHATGPHLHLELRRNAVPIDPFPYLLSAVATRASSAGCVGGGTSPGGGGVAVENGSGEGDAGAGPSGQIVRPTEPWAVEPPFVSKSRNSAFIGRTLTGRVRYTVRRGELTVSEGKATR